MADVALSVISVKYETPDVISILLDTKDQNIPYQAGQFFRLILPDVSDPRGPSRLFSNSSSPSEHDFFMFTTRVSQSPFKQKLKTLRGGDTVLLSGPFGKFVLGDASRSYVFLSGGIGITPFRSMLKYVSDEKLPHRITLLYSNHSVQDIIFKEELDYIANSNPNIKIVYTITKPQDSTVSWQGRTGRIDGTMIRECAIDIVNAFFYVCGPPAMVEALVTVVKGLGVPDENLKTELFTGYQ